MKSSHERTRLLCVGETVGHLPWVSGLPSSVCEVVSMSSAEDVLADLGKNRVSYSAVVLCDIHGPWRVLVSGLGGVVPVLVVGGNDAEAASVLEQGAVDCIPNGATAIVSMQRVLLVLEREGLKRCLRDRDSSLEKLMHDLQSVILPIGIALTVEKDVNRLLERILEEAKKLCNADAGTLYLRTEDNHLRFVIMRTDSLGIGFGGTTGKSTDTLPRLPLYDADGKENNHNIATHVALTGKSVNIADIYNSREYDWSATRRFDEKNHYKSISTLTVPLKDSAGKVIGVLQLFNPIDPETGHVTSFSSYQQLVFESLASQAAIVLANQTLLKSEQELMLVRRELEIGREIQASFMPKSLPEFKGWDIAATFSPAREVAGDFYDMFLLGPDKLVFAVADVCDKGVGAALFASLTRSLIRAFAHECMPKGAACSAQCVNCTPDMIGEFLKKLATSSAVEPMNPMCMLNMTNDYLIDVHGNMNMFVTMFVGMIDVGKGTLTYINAGHESPLLLAADQTIKGKLDQSGPAVGIVPKANYRAKKIELLPGESVVVFTDGIVDARNKAGGQFTRNRLLEECKRPAAGAEETLEHIGKAVWSHIGDTEQFDDITVMVLRRTDA